MFLTPKMIYRSQHNRIIYSSLVVFKDGKFDMNTKKKIQKCQFQSSGKFYFKRGSMPICIVTVELWNEMYYV